MSDLDFLLRRIHTTFLSILFLVLYLSYRDPINDIFLIVSLISLWFFVKSIAGALNTKRVVIILLMSFINYILVLMLLFVKGYDMNLLNNKTNALKEETAVLIVYEGEPSFYDLPRELNNISLQSSWSSKLKVPVDLYNTRIMYNKIGKSVYKDNTERVRDKLKDTLQEGYKVYIGYMNDSTYIEEAIFDIVNDGYDKIIIAPMFLTEDNVVNQLKTRVERLKLFNLNIQIRYTEPLWDSEVLCQLYSNKIINMIQEEKAKDIGVVMIGEGTKAYENDLYIKSIKQDLMFRKKVQDYLIKDSNLEKSKTRLSWFRDIEPGYIEEIKNLLEYGIGEIICIYNKPAASNIDNYIITQKIRSKIDMPEGVQIRVIDGFLSDDSLISELSKRIEFQNLQKWE